MIFNIKRKQNWKIIQILYRLRDVASLSEFSKVMQKKDVELLSSALPNMVPYVI